MFHLNFIKNSSINKAFLNIAFLTAHCGQKHRVFYDSKIFKSI